MNSNRACDACYKKKIQCAKSPTDGPCDWCNHHNLTCTFLRENKHPPRHKARYSDVQELHRRINQLETALAQSTRQSSSGISASSGSPLTLADQANTPTFSSAGSAYVTSPQARSQAENNPPQVVADTTLPIPKTEASLSNLAFGQIKLAGRHLGQNWYYKGLPLLSEEGQRWISSRTGEHVDLGSFALFGSQSCSQSSQPALLLSRFSVHDLPQLPERPVVEQILDIFFRSAFRLRFPVLDRMLLQDTIDAAYECPDASRPIQRVCAARACLFAALPVISRLKGAKQTSLPLSSEEYAARAQYLLGYAADQLSVENLQAIILLQYYRKCTGYWQNASALHSVACRIVSALGGTVYQPTHNGRADETNTDRKSRHCRLLFWLCYVADKDIALRSGYPPLLSDEFCDLTLPGGYVDYYYYLQDLEEEHVDYSYEHLIPHLPADLTLSYLKEQTFRLLYSPQAFRNTDSQMLLRIRQLDDDLERWRLSIPVDLRPQLSVPVERLQLPVSMKLPHAIRYLYLHLEYHYLITAIHTTVRRCGADATDIPEDLHGVYHSSIDLSLEGSRSTLLFLKPAITAMQQGAFWNVVYYTPVAAMSLFANILMHPLDVQALDDLELMVSAVGVIRRMPEDTPPQPNIDHIQELSDFIMKLVHLGNAAISQAKRAQRRGTG